MKWDSVIYSALLLCSIAGSLPAATIHSWVDAEGITHFSDTPPQAGTANATTIELAENFPPVVDAEADYYSIANQWSRMRAEREAAARLSLEKAKLRAVSAEPSAPPEYEESPRYYPVYYGPNAYYPRRHGSGFRRGDGFRDFERNPRRGRATAGYTGGERRGSAHRPVRGDPGRGVRFSLR